MNWLIASQPRVADPADVVEVRTYVVRAPTLMGARVIFEQQLPGQMIRWIRPERRTEDAA